MLQAVNVGKAMNAKHTILTHFSARYPKVPSLPDYLDENGVSVAMDNLVVSMEDLHKLPKMNNAYRLLYEEELFDIFYYIIAIANNYNINLEEIFYIKDQVNMKKYKRKFSLDDAREEYKKESRD